MGSEPRAYQLPDGSYPPPTWRASVYLFTRPFMLITALVGFCAMLGLLLVPAVLSGDLPAGMLISAVPISALCGFGFAALFGLWGFMAKCALTRPKPERGDNTELIASLKANHIAGDEGRGGTLQVSTAGVEFVPHRFNIQPGNIWMAHSEVSGVAWSRVFNATGMQLTTMMHVTTSAGTEHFVVPKTFGDALSEIALRAEAPPFRSLLAEA